jgi:hypothetical protein
MAFTPLKSIYYIVRRTFEKKERLGGVQGADRTLEFTATSYFFALFSGFVLGSGGGYALTMSVRVFS